MDAKIRLRIKTTTVSSFAQNVMEASSKEKRALSRRPHVSRRTGIIRTAFHISQAKNPHEVELRKSETADTIRFFHDSGRCRRDNFSHFQVKDHARNLLQSSFGGGHRGVA